MWKTQVRTGWYVPGWQCLKSVLLHMVGNLSSELWSSTTLPTKSIHSQWLWVSAFWFSMTLSGWCEVPFYVFCITLYFPRGVVIFWFLIQFSLFLSFSELYPACCGFPNDWCSFAEKKKKSSAIKIIICYSWKTKVSRVGLMMFSYLASLWLYSTSLMESIRC